MKFPGLIRPLYDETYHSWLFRCAIQPSVCLISEREIYTWVAEDFRNSIHQYSSLGVEFDFNESPGTEIASRLGFNKKYLITFFGHRSNFLLSPSYRVAYCHLCIASDVRGKKFPAWRKSWCYITDTYCVRHHCLLSHIDEFKTVDKQWGAFVTGNVGDYIQGRRSSYYRHQHGLAPSKARAWLTLRVQKWVHNLYLESRSILFGKKNSVTHNSMINAVYFMLRMLLSPKTDRAPAGVARDIFTNVCPVTVHKPLLLPERLRYGAVHSVPYERMCAMLLIGVIFRVFTNAELILLNNTLEKDDFSIPNVTRDLGVLCAAHVNPDEHKDLKKLIRAMGGASCFHRDFLNGLIHT